MAGGTSVADARAGPVRRPAVVPDQSRGARRRRAARRSLVEALGAKAGRPLGSRRGARSPDGRGQPPAAGHGDDADGGRGAGGRRRQPAVGRQRACATRRGWRRARPRCGRACSASNSHELKPLLQVPRLRAGRRSPIGSTIREAVRKLFDEANRAKSACKYNQRHEQSAGHRRRGGRRHSRRRHDHDGRLRALRHSRTPDRGAASPRHEGPHHHQQQRRHRRLRRRPAAAARGRCAR